MITFSATYSHNGSCGDGPGVSVRGATNRGGGDRTKDNDHFFSNLYPCWFVGRRTGSFGSWGHEPGRRSLQFQQNLQTQMFAGSAIRPSSHISASCV